MKVPEIYTIKDGFLYDTKTALLLATDDSGEANGREQYTYLFRANAVYFVCWPRQRTTQSDEIMPLDVAHARNLYEALPFKHIDVESAFSKRTIELIPEAAVSTAVADVSSQPNPTLRVFFTSGETIVIDSLLLYPAEALQTAQSMLMNGKAKMRGFSTGIGFLGSPGWVLGGAMLTGFLENMASNRKASEGLQIIEQAEALLEQLRHQGRWIPIRCVVNIDFPAPNLWSFEADEIIQSRETFYEKMIYAKRVNRKRRFIHNGEPYFRAKLRQGGECCVLWDKIERWEFRPC